MQLITEIPAMRQAISSLVASSAGAIPTHTLQAVLGASGETSPVDQFVQTCEALYAAIDDLPDAGKEVCGQLANVCTTYGWHDLGRSGRGALILGAVRRRLGEGEQPEADDPTPLSQYVG